MTIKDIRESGMLEQYVLGLLSEDQLREVNGYLVQYPELKSDLLEIERSLQSYAQKQAIAPKRDLQAEILQSVRDQGDKTKLDQATDPIPPQKQANPSSAFLKSLLFILGLAALASAYFAYQKNSDYQKLQSQLNIVKTDCEENSTELRAKLDLFEALNSPDNRILNITPTDGYQQTNLLFHTNPTTKKNYIQVRNLPNIAADQAFQLWSLKGGNIAPIPLTVFKNGDDYIIEVDYEEGTGTYAITIEREEGVQSPTLTRLIGTVNV